MIVLMKKAAVIVQQKDAPSVVRDLRSLGVLHVEHQNAPISKDISALQEDAALIDRALEIFSFVNVLEPSNVKNPPLSDWKTSAQHVISLWKHYDQLQIYSESMKHAIGEWGRWGNFDPLQIQDLAKKNIFVKLYQVPQKEADNFCDSKFVKKLATHGGISYCVVISIGPFECNQKEVVLPKQSLFEMRAKLAEDKKVMDSIINQIHQASALSSEFDVIKKNLSKEIELQEALYGMGIQKNLYYISGYLPVEQAESLTKEAKLRKWALAITDPADTDTVPVLIRNQRWVSIVEPIFKFLEILPDYREWDISLVFIFFFSLFFGMLIGDAGYGAVYMFLTFWIQKKTQIKFKSHPAFFLFYLLSFCAIIWGLLTGTFFGQEWFLKLGYKPLVPALNNPAGIQTFCFFVGALHLSIAHLWRAALKSPSVAALADIGWVCVVWSVFFLAKMLILGAAFPGFGNWLITIGISLVVIFNNPQKNILKIFNTDLITLALGLISSFGEVVSYIRLFAVGMAGVAIADAFNGMAASIGLGSVVAIIGSVFVVMLGHLLCLVLGPLSVLVHGIRLNLLEFSGHANISWSGSAYKPLRE